MQETATTRQEAEQRATPEGVLSHWRAGSVVAVIRSAQVRACMTTGYCVETKALLPNKRLCPVVIRPYVCSSDVIMGVQGSFVGAASQRKVPTWSSKGARKAVPEARWRLGPSRPRGAEAERHRGQEAQRPRGAEAHRHRGQEAQRPTGTEAHRHGGQEAQRRRRVK